MFDARITGRRKTATAVGAGIVAVLALGQVTPASAAPAARSTTVTSRVDVDGDGRADRTTLLLHSVRGDIHRFVLTVRTATGRTATKQLSVQSFNALKPRDVWMGATGIDGVRGNEIVLDLGGGIGDFRWIHSYGWRSGKLVTVAAPGGTRTDASWHETFPPFPVAGYTFSMRGSTRYVVKHALNPSTSGRTYSGWNTTYRWTNKGWQQVARSRTGVVSRAVADKKYVGLHGLIWR